jgi:hypothetical protein
MYSCELQAPLLQSLLSGLSLAFTILCRYSIPQHPVGMGSRTPCEHRKILVQATPGINVDSIENSSQKGSGNGSSARVPA